ncbi:LacI family DNA-binding transcriptional regulator [Ochrobactrum sp. Marseille-Q0166]
MNNSSRSKILITMQSVAKAAGVSPMTVSNSFRYPERVLEETRLRVFQVAAELGYVPNHSAGILSSGQSRVIGAVIPSMKNSSFYKYVRGMQDRATESGYELILKLAETKEDETAAIQTFIGLRVAGISLVGNQHSQEAIDLINKTQTPVVESWVTENPLDMAVGYSMTDATRSMTQLLIERGCKRIGFVGYGSPSARRYSDRLPAFTEAIAAAGLANHRICFVDEADGFGAGPKALDALRLIDPDIEGVICPTDIVAAGVIFECTRLGWKVPDRLAVTGWGDYEIASEITPGLSTIQPNAYEMGERSMELIIHRVSGGSVGNSVLDIGYDVLKRASA